MDERDLLELDARLRGILDRSGLRWVVTQLDEAEAAEAAERIERSPERPDDDAPPDDVRREPRAADRLARTIDAARFALSAPPSLARGALELLREAPETPHAVRLVYAEGARLDLADAAFEPRADLLRLLDDLQALVDGDDEERAR